MGRPRENLDAWDYEDYKEGLKGTIYDAFTDLKGEYDYIILEGAGSPAEINLMAHDIVNMGMARLIDCPVMLVGDIDKGGVFASFAGTLDLLPDDRDRIKGFIINKFRGDYELLRPGLDMLKDITGLPTAGVIPYMDLRLDEEDTPSEHSVSMGNDVDIAVIYLPHISNFTDFDPLLYYPGINLRYVKRAEDIGNPDVIIIPGSKNTIGDLRILKRAGIADRIADFYNAGGYVVGVCGGYQMMGQKITDPAGVEEAGDTDGLGIFDAQTVFEQGKLTVNSKDVITEGRGMLSGLVGTEVSGYEIHMGRTFFTDGSSASRKGLLSLDASGRAMGTYLHGIFENNAFTAGLINNIRRTKGLEPIELEVDFRKKKEEQYDLLADTVRKNLDMDFIYSLLN